MDPYTVHAVSGFMQSQQLVAEEDLMKQTRSVRYWQQRSSRASLWVAVQHLPGWAEIGVDPIICPRGFQVPHWR